MGAGARASHGAVEAGVQNTGRGGASTTGKSTGATFDRTEPSAHRHPVDDGWQFPGAAREARARADQRGASAEATISSSAGSERRRALRAVQTGSRGFGHGLATTISSGTRKRPASSATSTSVLTPSRALRDTECGRGPGRTYAISTDCSSELFSEAFRDAFGRSGAIRVTTTVQREWHGVRRVW